jgi:hypothetical protein
VYLAGTAFIGKDTFARFFDGQIGEVRLYNSALTSNQVITLYGGVAPTNAMVAYYDFEGNDSPTIEDISAKQNDGTATGTTLVANGGPDGSAAMSFDGVGDLLTTADDSTLDLSGDYTLSLWINIPAGESGGFLSKYSSEYSSGGYILNSVGSGANTINFYNGAWNTTSSIIPYDSWVFISITRDSVATKFYVNGVLDKTWAPSTIASNAGNLLIGGDYAGNHFKGKFDNIQIYNRALSANEIYQLFANGGPQL